MKYIVKIEDQFYEVEIKDLQARPIVAFVDGTPIEVWPQNVTAGNAPVKAAAAQEAKTPTYSSLTSSPVSASQPATTNANVQAVRAPIPGVIISVAVKPEDQVTIGQEICVLEAMKMKNTIRSPRAGKIASVSVSTGQTVNHNDILVEYEGGKA